MWSKGCPAHPTHALPFRVLIALPALRLITTAFQSAATMYEAMERAVYQLYGVPR